MVWYQALGQPLAYRPSVIWMMVKKLRKLAKGITIKKQLCTLSDGSKITKVKLETTLNLTLGFYQKNIGCILNRSLFSKALIVLADWRLSGNH